jgi:competence protein ComEA
LFLAAVCLLLMLLHPHRVRWPMAVEQDRLASVLRGVDANTATWAELAQLPGVGEITARQIIDFRGSHSAFSDPGGPVFARPADLAKVKGIGAATVRRIQPFLRISGIGEGR